MPAHLEIAVEAEDDWGFYIDIEAHDWNQVGASAPIKIQIENAEVTNNNGRRTHTPTKEEIQRHIKLSSPKETQTVACATCFTLNISKTIVITVAAAVCAFY